MSHFSPTNKNNNVLHCVKENQHLVFSQRQVFEPFLPWLCWQYFLGQWTKMTKDDICDPLTPLPWSCHCTLCSTSVSVPVTPLSTFMDSWIFGGVLCKVAGASQVWQQSYQTWFVPLRQWMASNFVFQWSLIRFEKLDMSRISLETDTQLS